MLLSDIFLVWDQFFAARPVLSIGAESESHRYLRCKNVTKCDITIKSIRTIPKTVIVARDHSVTAITDGLIGVRFSALVPPDTTCDFPLMIVRRGELLDDKDSVLSFQVLHRLRSRFIIMVSWRSSGSTWLPRWPVFIWSSMQAEVPSVRTLRTRRFSRVASENPIQLTRGRRRIRT